MTAPESTWDHPVQPGTVLLDKYRIDRVIGVGGMGVVFEALHLDFQEKVAIKCLLHTMLRNPEAVARFEREARVLFKIQSEFVCRVREVGKLPSGLPFMVMEYLEGRDLGEVLASGAPLPVADAIDLALQTAHALASAHACGIVHRDLKPENLFLVRDASDERVVKLLDFGLSKERGGPDSRRQRKLTMKEQVMGTPHYMSPEQWIASTGVGPATDQWALGAILFEMLTGEPPFAGAQLANVCSAIMNAPTPSVAERRPDAPPGLDAVLRKALEKNPRDRYQNVGAFAVALASFSRSGSAAKAERTWRMLQRSSVEEHAPKSALAALRSPQAASDMATTVKNPPRIDSFERPRSTTFTSWQRMQPHNRGSRARVATAVAVGVLVLVTGAAVAILAGTPSVARSTAAPRSVGQPAAGDASATPATKAPSLPPPRPAPHPTPNISENP